MNKKVYLVGGAVRDQLLGLEPKDKDYVIVGATPEDVEKMIADGYKQVGNDFPVFLHPDTGEEYALARVERKIGSGYNGFETFTSPTLTIEDDLLRRDLTINAMAIDIETGALVDPFGGKEDLELGILRHVSDAFAEDPLRILRLARFVARYNFCVNDDTHCLAEKLVGELKHLSNERIWIELGKLFSEPFCFNGVMHLISIGAFSEIFNSDKSFDELFVSITIEGAENLFNSLSAECKFISVTYYMKLSEEFFKNLKVPSKVQRKYRAVVELEENYDKYDRLARFQKIDFMAAAGLFNSRELFDSIQPALDFIHPSAEKSTLEEDLKKVGNIDCAIIAEQAKEKNISVKDAIFSARVASL